MTQVNNHILANHNNHLMEKVVESENLKKALKRVESNKGSAGVVLNGCCVATEEGTPQGGPISPLLANIMLNDLDHELAQSGHSFARYADDYNIYASSRRAGQRVYASIRKFIHKRLKLKVNVRKSAVDHPNRRKFLGFSLAAHNGIHSSWADNADHPHTAQLHSCCRRFQP